jgi:hypothetical protein
MPPVAHPTIPPPPPPATSTAAPTKKPWWEWVVDKVEDIEEWVDEVIAGHKKPPNGGHGGAYTEKPAATPRI